MSESSNESFRSRDATSFLVMGSFFVVLAVLVLLGTFSSSDFSFAVVLNVACGVVLLLIGVGLVVVARRMSRPETTDVSPSSTGVDGP